MNDAVPLRVDMDSTQQRTRNQSKTPRTVSSRCLACDIRTKCNIFCLSYIAF